MKQYRLPPRFFEHWYTTTENLNKVPGWEVAVVKRTHWSIVVVFGPFAIRDFFDKAACYSHKHDIALLGIRKSAVATIKALRSQGYS